MTESIEIEPCVRPVRATVTPPGSKSITNRALICAALASGQSTLNGALDSDDTRVMIAGLRRLGVELEIRDEGATIVIKGCGGPFPASTADIFVGNSGTTIRFLTAAASLGGGRIRLDGVPRMRERPIRDLVNGLNQLGAKVTCENDDDCPPVVVDGKGLAGGRVVIRGDISSQFLSGLLMAAPYANADVVLEINGQLVSTPYVEMTRRVMNSFGASVEVDDAYHKLGVAGSQKYDGQVYSVEPDASAASYFFAAAAITGGVTKIEGLGRNSMQGDVAFCDVLQQMGCEVHWESDQVTVVGASLRGVDVDMNAISDTVQTLAVVALFANGPTRIRNVGHIRHKETDRVSATAAELRKLGAVVTESDEGLAIDPAELRPAVIDTYEDHRMAMSFAIAGLKIPGVVIKDPDCTAKTYPQFFKDLSSVVSTT